MSAVGEVGLSEDEAIGVRRAIRLLLSVRMQELVSLRSHFRPVNAQP